MSEAFASKRVLVTGGTGFIGSHLVNALLMQQAQVSVLVRDRNNLGRLEPLRESITLVGADLLHPETLVRAVAASAPSYVFHLAAFGVEQPLSNYEETLNVNLNGTFGLLTALVAYGSRNLDGVLFAGTAAEYGTCALPCSEQQAPQPSNYYAASKSAAWNICQTFFAVHQIPLVGVRPFMTYGPDQGKQRLVPFVIRACLENAALPLTACEQTRDLIYIQDVVCGIMDAIQHAGAHGQMFNLGSGVGVSLRTVVNEIIRLCGADAVPQFGALPYRPGEIWELYADISKAQQVLGWTPRVSLDEGLEKTIAWYRKQAGN